MTTRLKRWTQLGLSAALASGTLVACGAPETTADQSEAELAAPTPPIEADEPAAAEAGEGEGGVVFANAVTDPVAFLSILAITEAHIIAARDAHALGENEAAAEMFAHPVSEVLFESQSVFEQLGVVDFSDLLTETSAAIFAGETPEQINVRADEIIAALRTAATKAPASDASAASVAAGVAVDQIERAADMYRIALESDEYEPYLDGYGFFKAGEAVFLESAEAISTEDQAAAYAIKDAIAKLEDAYPSAVRPDSLDADLGTVTVAASNAVIAVQN
ncbi:MAG: hypothetical protein HRT80_04685 [Henriciella sp.]|nr:hypothetical protein [Henriciella sp.]